MQGSAANLAAVLRLQEGGSKWRRACITELCLDYLNRTPYPCSVPLELRSFEAFLVVPFSRLRNRPTIEHPLFVTET